MKQYFTTDVRGRIVNCFTAEESCAEQMAMGNELHEGVPPEGMTYYIRGEFAALSEEASRMMELMRRNHLLQASDWTQLPDAPVKDRAAWAAYRQALRDLPEQPGFPHNIKWPQEPK